MDLLDGDYDDLDADEWQKATEVQEAAIREAEKNNAPLDVVEDMKEELAYYKVLAGQANMKSTNTKTTSNTD